ncbi:MAG: hypothetical protein ACI855_003716 [Myxococcota bacterium]|jgi:uncharacterized protein (TIGR03382 family)
MNKPIAGLLCAGLAGCAFDSVEHASHVEAGAVLGVTLRLSGGGAVSGSAAVCAGLPVGWTVERASYTGSASGADVISGMALEDLQAAMQFGVRPDVVWSCWTHAGDEEWGDASSGVVSMDIHVPPHASGPHALLWSLGTTGLAGELLSATATSTVRVSSPGHPLDAVADLAAGSVGEAVVGTPNGFLSIGASNLSMSTNGIDWSVTGEGVADLVGASYGGDTLWAWTHDSLSYWTPQEAWQPSELVWSTDSMDAIAMGSGLLVVEDDNGTLQQVDQGGAQAGVVPQGAEPGGLVGSGSHVVWRLWNSTLRQPELGYSQDEGISWLTVSAPVLPIAVGQYDRVGVSQDGTLLWANVSSTSTGAHASLWYGSAAGDWQALGTWAVGELAPTTTPVACNERWVVGLPWGGWLAVDDGGVVSRHALGRSADTAEYLCAGAVVAVVQAGQVSGVAAWANAPDLSALVLPDGVVGDAYSTRIAPTQWTVQIDGLPSGLTVDEGRLLGVPAQAGVFEVRVEATDAWSRAGVAVLSLNIDEASVELPDDPDTDAAEPDSDTEGEDVVVEDLDTDDRDLAPVSDTASVDVQPAGGCNTVPAPQFLMWPLLGVLLGLRRRC